MKLGADIPLDYNICVSKKNSSLLIRIQKLKDTIFKIKFMNLQTVIFMKH